MNKNNVEQSILSRKLIKNNITIIVGLCFLFFSIFLCYYVTQQEKQIATNMETTLDAKTLMFEQVLEVANFSTIQLRLNPKILEIFEEIQSDEDMQNYFKQNPHALVEAYNEMTPYIIQGNCIGRICIYNDKGDFVAVGNYVDYLQAKKYADEERISFLDEHFNEETRLFEIYENDQLYAKSKAGGYISIVQELEELSYIHGERMGYVEIQINIGELKEQLGDVADDQYLRILNNGESFLEIGNKDMQMSKNVYYNETEQKQFILEVQQAKLKGLNATSNNIIALLVILILLIIIMYYVQKRLIRNITLPLITLCKNIQLEQLEFVDVDNMTGEVDEIKQLNETMNLMLERINESVNQVIVEKTDKMNAQMLALQAHINPHFIHNTLAVITSLVEMEEGDKAVIAIEKLSSMIRHSADYSKSKVLLEEELDSIRDYLELIKIKYEDSFNYDIIIEGNIEKVQSLKYMVQPLVENSIHHSLHYTEYPWHIEIRCKCDGEKWQIEISDNGVGIAEDKAQSIKEKFEILQNTEVDELLNQLKIGGYSMMNTLVRMNLFYKGNAIFDIKKNEKGGTTVIIGSH